jgi:hypothetical protein
MAILSISKVTSLPSTYTPSTLYFVPVGNNTTDVDIYISSSDGSTVRKATSSGGGIIDLNTLGFIPTDNFALGPFALSSNTLGVRNTAVGINTMLLSDTGEDNTAFGFEALKNNVHGFSNVGIGISCLFSNTTGWENTAVGTNSLKFNTEGSNNTAVGSESLTENTTGVQNSAVGSYALRYNTTGNNNTGVGSSAIETNTTGGNNTAVGAKCLSNANGADNNTGIGTFTLQYNTSGYSNTAGGSNCLRFNSSGFNNTALGASSLLNNTLGNNNVAIGVDSTAGNTEGLNNTAVGVYSLYFNTTGNNNTAVGYSAGFNTIYDNTTCLGSNSDVTGNSQVQLGDSTTTTYVYGTVQNRSDLRDKADVRDTVLGLGFINSLRPVDYKWDIREDYKSDMPVKPELSTEATDEEIKANDDAYKAVVAAYIEANKLSNLNHDGSKKRSRYHHGFIAQEVKQLIETTGIDFGGFQDHAASGGEDVMSIGYDELITPLIKAVQELSAKVIQLETQLSSK